ncbi:hypothetical protein BH23ACT5_BH23ACT5_20850 [soil metagenome]
MVSVLRSHGRGHRFDPSSAHCPQKQRDGSVTATSASIHARRGNGTFSERSEEVDDMRLLEKGKDRLLPVLGKLSEAVGLPLMDIRTEAPSRTGWQRASAARVTLVVCHAPQRRPGAEAASETVLSRRNRDCGSLGPADDLPGARDRSRLRVRRGVRNRPGSTQGGTRSIQRSNGLTAVASRGGRSDRIGAQVREHLGRSYRQSAPGGESLKEDCTVSHCTFSIPYRT